MKKALIGVLIVAIFSVVLVSAFWPFETTGNVIADETYKEDVGSKCDDTDDGIFAKEAGAARDLSGRFGVKVRKDRCIGESKIREYYCDERGKIKSQKMSSEELGVGHCEKVTIDVMYSFGKIKEVKSAKWVPDLPVCEFLENGKGVKDNKETYRDGCEGEDGKTYTTYSCGGAFGATVKKDETVCPVKCSKSGCVGNCVDTDEANDKDIAGKVTLDGTDYLDECTGTNNVKQFYCVDGKLKKLVENCGVNRECVESDAGDYCVDIYTGVSTTETLADRIEALEQRVNQLTIIVEALKGHCAVYYDNFFRGDCDAGNSWCGGGDFNQDGSVDTVDWAEHFRETC